MDAVQPSIDVKGISTMRLQRLHLSSSPCPRTFAISWPHSQRVSPLWVRWSEVDVIFMVTMVLVNDIENDY